MELLFSYKSIIHNLRDEAEALQKKRADVQLLVDTAESNAEIVKPEVLEWLKKVDDTMKEVDDVLDATSSNRVKCCYGLSSNPKSQYLLSKRATKETSEVIKLRVEGKFVRVADPAPPVQLLPSSNLDFKGFGSRMLIKKDVLNALKDNKTSVIGIWGVAGVGKTTMMEEIANKVKVESVFDEVVVANITQNPDIKCIQDQVANELRLTISEKINMQVRAKQLEAGLKDGGKRILVILDELWQNLDFHTLGIPIGKDYSRAKVLLISRNQEVCYKMNAQSIFEVKVLSKREAWYLLKKTAGIPDDVNNALKHMAEEITNECGGVPLAVITIAKALRNKNQHAWNDALQQLKKSNLKTVAGQSDLVYSRIELCYNYMENDEAKSLLLLCCLFPEDYYIPIEHLVRYGRGLRMFKSTRTLAEVRETVESLVDYLEGCYLLLASGAYKCVKLHDVVRDVCLSNASKEEQILKITDPGLKEQPQNDSYKTCNAISMRFQEMVQLPSGLECPRLKLLWLLFQSSISSISDDFFKGMKELRVLNINKMDIGLPSSLQSLTSLQTLSLDFCRLSTGIALIGKLKRLEILSFYLCYLNEIPKDISDLSNLTLLDLRFREGPYPVPSGVLSGLKKLEELYLGDYFQHDKGENEMDRQLVSEIISLSHLRTLQISINDTNLLLQVLRGLSLEKLERFHIIRKAGKSTVKYQFSRSLELLEIERKVLLDPVIVMLVRRTEYLILGSKGLRNLVNELDEDGFINLKKLVLQSGDYEYLIDVMDVALRNHFTNLETLELDGLKSLKEICKGNLPVGSFSRLKEVKLKGLDSMSYLWRGHVEPLSLCNLRVLKMQSCHAIRSIFPESMLQCLAQLQEMDIADCKMLDEVVSREENARDAKMVQLSKLKFLRLDSLSNFKSFLSESGTRPSNEKRLQALFNQVSLPSMEVLLIKNICGSEVMVGSEMQAKSLLKIRIIKVHNCEKLQKVAISDSVKLLQNLEQLEIEHCDELEVVFDFEGLKVTGEDTKAILCHLETLKLLNNGISDILRMVPKGINRAFRNLRSLEVHFCQNLSHLFSPSIARMFVSLEQLELGSLWNIKEIITKGESSSSEDGVMAASKIVFPKLSCIVLRVLIVLEIFSSQNSELVCPSLTKLHIVACPEMKRFSAGKLNAPNLKKIHTSSEQIVPLDLQDREVLAVLNISEGECTIL